ncbi:MAG: putative toxin-antitoxin system toxin component, PIN family [Dehalococcoidia bacterium]|nr:putative toxin-antitoxin system toxin component, PIN family [Dehalococcoidia bacterium]
MKIFLDTNVLISAYTARGISADLVRHILAEHDLVTGEVNLEELRRVLTNQFHAPADVVEAVVSALRAGIIAPRPAEPSAIPVRDPDDRWVLASAIESGADMLVTGDQDLLAVANVSPISIMNPRGCWERLRAGT